MALQGPVSLGSKQSEAVMEAAVAVPATEAANIRNCNDVIGVVLDRQLICQYFICRELYKHFQTCYT